MPFEKGQSGNPAGRPKGTANKITEDIKEAFALVLESKLPELEMWINQVAENDPAKAIDLMIKLSNRFLPELARTEITGADGSDLFKNLKFNFGQDDDQRPDIT